MTPPARFRFSLESLSVGARPRLGRAGAGPAQDDDQNSVWQEVSAQALAVEQDWSQVERFVQEHGPCGELHLREVWVRNEADRSLVDRVDLVLCCRAHSVQFVREVVPDVPAPVSELVEPVARLREDLAVVERTGCRPERVQTALTLAWRRVEAMRFPVEHRRCGGRFEAGEGRPARLALVPGGAPEEIEGRVWLRCGGCGRTTTWSTGSPEEAAACSLARCFKGAGPSSRSAPSPFSRTSPKPRF